MPTPQTLDAAALFGKYGVPQTAQTDGLARALEAVAAASSQAMANSVVRELAAAIRRHDLRQLPLTEKRAILVPTKWLDLN
jgi:hypothetical protein